MMDVARIDVVPVASLHERLRFTTPLAYAAESQQRPFSRWKMEVDDAPILRYLYRHFRPRRHLEFGTWEGTGACYCLQECDATVWTLNLPHGESVNGEPLYASADPAVIPRGATAREQRTGREVYQTDAGVFIGHHYRDAGFGHRVCQVYCDSRDWDISAYPPGFFDTALIDGGHSPEVVLSDTHKALSVVRSGGLILWHDFCPDPAVFDLFPSVEGVVGALTEQWPAIATSLHDAFWIRPSFLLAGIR